MCGVCHASDLFTDRSAVCVCVCARLRQLASNFGPVAPFDASLVLLLVGGVLIITTWSENYGDNRVTSACCFSSVPCIPSDLARVKSSHIVRLQC
jgi:hypothetical protein